MSIANYELSYFGVKMPIYWLIFSGPTNRQMLNILLQISRAEGLNVDRFEISPKDGTVNGYLICGQLAFTTNVNKFNSIKNIYYELNEKVKRGKILRVITDDNFNLDEEDNLIESDSTDLIANRNIYAIGREGHQILIEES